MSKAREFSESLRSMVGEVIALIKEQPQKTIHKDALLAKLDSIDGDLALFGGGFIRTRNETWEQAQERGKKISARFQKKREEYPLVFSLRNGDKYVVKGWENICKESGLSEITIRQRLTPSSKIPPSFVDADGDLITISRPK